MLNTNGYDSNISHAKSFTSASTDYSVTVDTFASDEDGTVGTGTEAVLHARSFMTSNTMSQDDLENNSMMGDELLFRESTYRTCRADANVSGELTMKGLHGGHCRNLSNKGKSRSLPKSKLSYPSQRLYL